MKRILTIAAILFATVSFSFAAHAQKEYTSHDTDRLFQGLLYKDGQLFQFFDGGMVNVLDAKTMAFKRSFQLPYHGHYSTVEWLDAHRFATTDYKCNLYVTDIADENNMTVDTLHLSSLNPAFYTSMAALAYDKDRKFLYVSGYSPDKNFRKNVVTSVLDLSGYMKGSSRQAPLLDVWEVPSYHLQDGCFYKGLVWHLTDKTVGTKSKPYDILAVYALNPVTKSISEKHEIPIGEYSEAQGIAIVDGRIIISDVPTTKTCRYYEIDMKESRKRISEELLLSPKNPERNALYAGYGLYDFTSERVDRPAPKGYEPFYMACYCRHGARFLSDDSDYKLIHDVLSSVPDDGLTPLGRVLSARYESIYPTLLGRGGDLTETGKRELSLLGRRYAKAFPEIFRKGAAVAAECSKVPRCIVSASYFCDALDDAGCKVDLDINSVHADSLIRRKWYPAERDAYRDSLLHARVDIEGICKRLFKDGSSAVSGDAAVFVCKLWALACDMPNTPYSDVTFIPAFSYEDLVALKSVEDDMYRYGRRAENSVETEYSRGLLDYIFRTAEEDIADGNKVSARLFFGHDTPLMSLMCLLNPEGWADSWSTSDIPVAANLRIVFYRNGEDILYKVQLNESDVTGYMTFTR